MATLLFTALGTLIGGPLGGAIGALAGRQIDGAIIGRGSREGPRLKELSVTTSSYGTPLPRCHGRIRAAGSIIWATDLVERKERQGGGKGRPSVTTYSYSASFAVALASRPISGVGRIWADGNLLRGEAGDLKSAGTFRLHTGERDQAPDPLIAAAEGADRCPAFRGIAYAVFENLDLSDFFNRIPALTFEVFADDDAPALQDIVGEVVADADANVALEGIAGIACEGPPVDTLRLLEPLLPMDCDAAGDTLAIARRRLQPAPLPLPEPAIAVDDDAFGGASGFSRRRAPPPADAPGVLRYYDLARDYQPGLQRAAGRPAAGEPRVLELPAALDAATARRLVDAAARRAAWAQETIAWRCTELDPAVRPGALVSVPGTPGDWLVSEWELRDSGVELSLVRQPPAGIAGGGLGSDPGRGAPPTDLPAPPTALCAFELPWDGSGSGDVAATFAAVSASGPEWAGAALYLDDGSGALTPLGPTGRARGTMGVTTSALAAAHPLLADRTSSVTVRLVDPAMSLADATVRQLAAGANRALIGAEIVQFARAAPLGDGEWRLDGLLRGRGGTEDAAIDQAAGEPFVLLDGSAVALDASALTAAPMAAIVAIGRGDAEPVVSPIRLRGIGRRPPTPVHPRMAVASDGGVTLRWTRRARGGWTWGDGVDAPLHEQAEAYLVDFGPAGAAPVARWTLSAPALDLSAAAAANLRAQAPGGEFVVRQQGSYALSGPLLLGILP